MTTIRYQARRRPFATAGAAVLAALSFSLTACSGGADGEYIKADSTSYYLTVKIDGNKITLSQLQCDMVKATNIGTISQDQSQISWTQNNIPKNTGLLTKEISSMVASKDAVNIDGNTYSPKDSDQGKAVIATVEKNCANN